MLAISLNGITAVLSTQHFNNILSRISVRQRVVYVDIVDKFRLDILHIDIFKLDDDRDNCLPIASTNTIPLWPLKMNGYKQQ